MSSVAINYDIYNLHLLSYLSTLFVHKKKKVEFVDGFINI